MKFKILKSAVLSVLFFSTLNCAGKNEPKASTDNQTIKVALLLDTSSSMDGLINQAKAQLWDIVNELSYAKCDGESPDLKIALYEYGNSRLTAKSGYIKLITEFTSDLDEISEHLFGLTTSGGNEYCGQVIDNSVKKLDWGNNKKDLKMVFIAGNEPFTQGEVNFKDAITNAKENDITINTIYCGDYNQGISGSWKEGATLGSGDYMTINHNKNIVHVITPYDDEIIILNEKLNKTYIYYGRQGVSKYKKQALQDSNANELDEVVAVKRAVTKSSKLYDNAGWDLVDAAKKKKINYSEIKKSQLPENLKNKSNKEIENYVVEKSQEREKIQQKIQELNKKRKIYVTEKKQQKTKKNELESALINAIKKQAKKKNYVW